MSQGLVDAGVDPIEFMFDQDWTDGLPVVPPTPQRVAAMLAAGQREPGEALGSVPAQRKTVTAELAAINAVMAGCRPEYFPLVVAAVQAVLDPAFNVNGVASSTGGPAICVVVSGPMSRAVGMNHSTNVLGSGNRANATIGRAVRLLVANGLNMKTGKLDAASIGHPGKYSFCFAEKEPTSPWRTLSVERGYDADDTTVTVFAAEGPRQVANALNEDPIGVLRTFASAMRAPSNFITGKLIGGKGAAIIVVLGHEHELAVRNSGMSQAEVRAFLAEEGRVFPKQLTDAGIIIETGAQHDMTPGSDGKLPVVSSPDDVILVTAGGPGAGWSAIIPSWAGVHHSRPTTRRVPPLGEALPDCGPESCEMPASLQNLIAEG